MANQSDYHNGQIRNSFGRSGSELWPLCSSSIIISAGIQSCAFNPHPMDPWKKSKLVRIILPIWALVQVCWGACLSPTVQCGSWRGCDITNFRGWWQDRKTCRAARVVYPKTEQDLVRAVADAVREGRKIKVMSAGAHTFNRFACPGGNEGVLISTRDYNSGILVDKASKRVTVDAGVQLRDVIHRLAEEGLTLPHSTYWDGVSMAGVVSTAAHGSGLWGNGSALHEYVVAMRLVVPAPPYQGYAKLITLTQADEDLKAARVSLGVLGAISRLTFAVESMFKRAVILDLKDDFDLEDAFAPFARRHEFGDITWYPSQHKAVYRIDDRVPLQTPGAGRNLQILFRPQTVRAVVRSRIAEEEIQAKKDAGDLCTISDAQLKQTMQAGGGFLNDGQLFRGYPVIGYNYLMQSSSGCQSGSCPAAAPLRDGDIICGWDSRVNGSFFFHTSIAIPLSSVRKALVDLKELRNLDPTSLCGVDFYGGLLMRYFKKSEAYLGFKEDTVDIEFFYYRSRQPNVPRWNEHVMEEMEQLLLQKYGGRPHWAKNRVFAFEGAAKGAVSLDNFLWAKQRLDPFGFFSSEWSDGVLGIGRVQRWRVRCAHDGLCVCRLDRHCSPRHGFFCRPGRIWMSARVCRPDNNTTR